MEEFEQAWERCDECDGEGQIKNLTYDPDHLCNDGYDCECEDSQNFFICEPCNGDGWIEILEDD